MSEEKIKELEEKIEKLEKSVESLYRAIESYPHPMVINSLIQQQSSSILDGLF